MNIGKKLLSLLTVFCLTLSLVPTVALATTSNATSVTIGGVQMVSGNQVTYYNNSGTSSQTGNATNYNAKYDPVSGTLTLNNLELNNNEIYANGNLTIQLMSNTTSKITNDSNAILVNGNLTIKGPGALNATGGSWGTAIYANGTITVREGAVISATTTSTSTQAIHSNEIIVTGSGTTVDAISEGNDLAIKANASLFVDDAGKLKVTNTGNDDAISVLTGSFSVYKTSGNQVIAERKSSTTYYVADAKSTVATYSVSGNVTDGSSAAIVGANIQLCSTTGTANAGASAVITNSDGQYTIENVPAGTYTIQVSKVGYTSASTPQQVTVNGDLTAQDYTLTPIQYDVYVAGTQVTGANMNNVLNSTTGTTGTPTVVYTPAGEGTPQTLTLNGVNITNTSSDTSATHHSGIEASDNLIIDLKGDNNTISGSGHAINMTSGALTISGLGSLRVSSNSGQTTVYTNDDVTIKDGAKITATNTSDDLGDAFDLGTSNHNLTISDSDTEAIARKTNGNQVAINHVSTLTVNDGATLTAQSKGTAISCTTFSPDSNSSVKVAGNYNGTGANDYSNSTNLNSYKYVAVQPKGTTSTTYTVTLTSGTGYTLSAAQGSSTAVTSGGSYSFTLNIADGYGKDDTNFKVKANETVLTPDSNGVYKIEGITENQNVTVDGVVYVKVEPIRVTSVTLSESNLPLKTNQTATLTATVNPSDAAVRDVTWASSDTNVARVNVAGATCKVTAVGVGTATITVLTKDGGYTDTCTVTVSNPSSSSGSHTTYYSVNTPAKSEGGSVVVSPKSASKGSAVTVTVTPESGYQASSVQAVDKDGKKLTLTDKGDGKYSFVMPGSKVEVSASFAQVQKPEETSPYRDVSKDSYYYDAVQWASNKGITNGVADGVFAPDWVCTRGQIVTFLWRSVGSPAPKTAEMTFADVAEDAYYAQAVLWAVENGITKGMSETTFSPDQTCTRAHAVAFLYRLDGSPAVTGSSFQDVAADAYYNAAVAWAVQQGITKGTSETTFSPDETCTRAQIVTFLYRMDQAK